MKSFGAIADVSGLEGAKGELRDADGSSTTEETNPRLVNVRIAKQE